ncbi:MAG: phospholipid-binding lipoprotein MlaA [Halocynthiibacter sp.]|jgi:phospholipid-binding lipoprotein MlaA
MKLTVNKILILPMLALVLGLSACGAPQVAQGVHDPYEAENRIRHEANRAIDRALLKPASGAYGSIIPGPVRDGVSNVAQNLSMPSVVLNDLLQGRIDDAAHNSLRFLLNTTIGIGGLFDFGSKNGLELRDSDFGETMHVWGAREGPYLELPVLGPSTTRDVFGKAVDLVINPLNFVIKKPEAYVAPVASVASRVGDRYRYSSTVDSVLYESADSYTQARLIYLENRRYALGATSDDSVYDLYEDLYD